MNFRFRKMLRDIHISRFYLHLLVLLVILQSSFTERRIKGKVVPADDHKRYAVYLLKASTSIKYTGWTCGGAIVCRSCVITSAACIEDVEHVYVISGYNKYIAAESIDNDECTKNMKKKVTFTCVPLNYTLDYNKTAVWSYIDIALIQVESEFDFNDPRYEQFCSYKPKIIEINYELPPQRVGNDAFVLGWGHKYKWRNDKDGTDLNEKTLRYAPTRIMDKTECKKYYNEDRAMEHVIDKYMLCTLQRGNLDSKGTLIERVDPAANGCDYGDRQFNMGPECLPIQYGSGEILDVDPVVHVPDNQGQENVEDLSGDIVYLDDTRKRNYKAVLDRTPTSGNDSQIDNKVQNTTKKRQNQVNRLRQINNIQGQNRKQNGGKENVTNDYGTAYESDSKGQDMFDSQPNDAGEKPGKKVPGFCQNDHGGPLVTWEGMHEILIGVASVFKLDGKNHCRGPYLFTSTQCNGGFLNCLINEFDGKDRSRKCMTAGHGSYELVQRRISWVGHPDGPADNEKILSRAQIPMSAFQQGR